MISAAPQDRRRNKNAIIDLGEGTRLWGIGVKSIPKAPGAAINQEGLSSSELKSIEKGEYGCTDIAELVFIYINIYFINLFI